MHEANSRIEDPNWPFARLRGSDGRAVGWSLVHGPVVTAHHHERLAALRRDGERFVGMTSYMRFPSATGDHPLDYAMLCEAWCHCFRAPDAHLPAGQPRALLSLSDFCDPQRIARERIAAPEEHFDVVYVGTDEAWKREAKNWPLAARCIPRMTREFGWRALVVGTPSAEFPPTPGVCFVAQLPWRELLGRIAGARLLFVPNGEDASPRVIAEALCLDVPIVVNRRILGGWKYVNAFTGAFFDTEDDLLPAVSALAPLGPLAWFRANHGPYLAGQRLLALIRRLDPALAEPSHLAVDGA